jgi:type IV pilus assembly protein PilB
MTSARPDFAEDSLMNSVNLSNMRISPNVLEIVPEAVARENVLIPIAEENGMVRIAMRDPYDYDTLAKVQFILARDIAPALASEEQIVAAIDRHYGHS